MKKCLGQLMHARAVCLHNQPRPIGEPVAHVSIPEQDAGLVEDRDLQGIGCPTTFAGTQSDAGLERGLGAKPSFAQVPPSRDAMHAATHE
ncbi:MAG: hypothetical protein QG671_3986 [Actinomycetota bacterium]|nr:hypothetical protein [Actinomycetota bacterium]MDQ5974067.1 hypothetical protein [Actinomycetota bacterium]